jgi:hypothetical protein
MAAPRPSLALTWRHGAPTWGPTQWGGEGTTSRTALVYQGSSPLPRRTYVRRDKAGAGNAPGLIHSPQTKGHQHAITAPARGRDHSRQLVLVRDQSRGDVPLHLPARVGPDLALDTAMSRRPSQGVFTWNNPATHRAANLTAPETSEQDFRRPFSKPRADRSPITDSALKTARIYLFTGSNTPYESHE